MPAAHQATLRACWKLVHLVIVCFAFFFLLFATIENFECQDLVFSGSFVDTQSNWFWWWFGLKLNSFSVITFPISPSHSCFCVCGMLEVWVLIAKKGGSLKWRGAWGGGSWAWVSYKFSLPFTSPTLPYSILLPPDSSVLSPRLLTS